MIFRRALFALTALALSVCAALAQFADQATFAGTGAGTGNAQTLTLPNASSLADIQGVLVKYIPGATNTGDATLTVNGFGSPPHFRKVTNLGLAALTGGELVTGQPVIVMYDGSFFDILSSATPNATPPAPQGYLTPCQVSSGSPVSGCTAGQIMPSGDVAAATVLYYEPMIGAQVPVYNGSIFVVKTFAELTLTIPSSRLANTLYDVCITTTTAGAYDVNGSPTAVFSIAWSTSTAGSGTRGTGGGTAQIGQINGVWTNSVVISGVNGATTYTIPSNTCTIVATVLINGTNGQTTFNRTFGSSRMWSVYNFFNQQPISLKAGDSTASWTYSTATWRASHALSTNSLTVLQGLPNQTVKATFAQQVSVAVPASTTATFNTAIGIGWNSTTAPSGMTGLISLLTGGPLTTTLTSGQVPEAIYIAPPFIGQNVVTGLENNLGGQGSSMTGTESGMLISADWRG